MRSNEEVKELMNIIKYKIELLYDTPYNKAALDVGNKIHWHLDDMYEYLYEYDDDKNDMYCNGYIEECGCYNCLQTIIRLKNMLSELESNYNDKLYDCLIDDSKELDKAVIELNRKKQKSNRIKLISIGFVYIIKVNDYYKIGKTIDMSKRIGEYTKLMEEPEIIICEEVNNYSTVEKELHEMFKEKNTRGEWFSLSEDDLAAAIEFINSNKLK